MKDLLHEERVLLPSMEIVNRQQFISKLEEYVHREHWEKPLFIYGHYNDWEYLSLHSIDEIIGLYNTVPNPPLFHFSGEYYFDDNGPQPLTSEIRNRFWLPVDVHKCKTEEEINRLPLEEAITYRVEEHKPIVYDYGLFNDFTPIEAIDIEYCQWLIQQTHRPVIMIVSQNNNRVLPHNIHSTEAYEYVCTLEDWEEWLSSKLPQLSELERNTARIILSYLHDNKEDFQKISPEKWYELIHSWRRYKVTRREDVSILNLTPQYCDGDYVFFSDLGFSLFCIEQTQIVRIDDDDTKHKLISYVTKQLHNKEKIALHIIETTKACEHLNHSLLQKSEKWTVVDLYKAYNGIEPKKLSTPSETYQFAVYKMVVSWLENIGNHENYESYLNSLDKLDELLRAWQILRYNVPNEYYKNFAEAFEALFSSDTQVPNMDKTFAELKSEVLRN